MPVLKSHQVTEDEQMRVSRITAVVLGVLAIGILANGQNVAFLVALAFAVAFSANLPTIVYSLYWRRFNTRGAVEHVRRVDLLHRADRVLPGGVGEQDRDDPGRGLPVVSAVQPRHRVDPVGVPPRNRRDRYPRDTGDPALNAEMEVRSLTGVGAEKATHH